MATAIKLAALVAGTTFCTVTLSATLTGEVVGVSDGDTITVLDTNKIQHKIRLSGIDAPEKKQGFGERSKQHLSGLVFAKTVTVEWKKTDKYRRMLGKVLVDGKDANLEQIRTGFAWHYKQYQNDQSPSDRSIYSRTEAEARNRRIGLWQDAKPIPPWDFRHGTGDAAISSVQYNSTSCSCDGNRNNYCTGKHGGRYCFVEYEKKRYIH
jgi:endonuclease YncB( thermonuclease family)